jgi:AcrR family transcriptional regulator
MIHNSPRGRGRPRSFDESAALARAIQVFWQKGYDGVTIDDLVAAMGVGRPSLYSIFGDKRTIFLRALRTYAEGKGARAAQALQSPATLRDSLASFLKFNVTSATEKGSARGCLLMCVAPLVDDAEVRQFVRSAASGAAAMAERRFQDARRERRSSKTPRRRRTYCFCLYVEILRPSLESCRRHGRRDHTLLVPNGMSNVGSPKTPPAIDSS